MAGDKNSEDSFGYQGRVLIVDDDKNLLKFIRAALESEGYQCETAMSPLSALELVGKE